MSETHVVIPVKDELHYTRSITAQLRLEDVERVWMLDNGSAQETWDYLGWLMHEDCRFVRLRCGGLSLYEMWNRGFSLAKNVYRKTDVNVAILNNDIILEPGTMSHLSAALWSESDIGLVYPNYERKLGDTDDVTSLKFTTGTYRHGGMCGWCFMLRAEAVDWTPLVDPQFEWWCGDDDIAFNLTKHGWKQARLTGVPLFHHGEGTVRHHDFHGAKARDLARVKAKWGK